MTDLTEIIARADCGAKCDMPKCSHEYTPRGRETCRRISFEAASRVLSTLSTAGYVIVPREPTEAMMEAPPPIAGENPGIGEIWKDMIAAALPDKEP